MHDKEQLAEAADKVDMAPFPPRFHWLRRALFLLAGLLVLGLLLHFLRCQLWEYLLQSEYELTQQYSEEFDQPKVVEQGPNAIVELLEFGGTLSSDQTYRAWMRGDPVSAHQIDALRSKLEEIDLLLQHDRTAWVQEFPTKLWEYSYNSTISLSSDLQAYGLMLQQYERPEEAFRLAVNCLRLSRRFVDATGRHSSGTESHCLMVLTACSIIESVYPDLQVLPIGAPSTPGKVTREEIDEAIKLLLDDSNEMRLAVNSLSVSADQIFKEWEQVVEYRHETITSSFDWNRVSFYRTKIWLFRPQFSWQCYLRLRQIRLAAEAYRRPDVSLVDMGGALDQINAISLDIKVRIEDPVFRRLRNRSDAVIDQRFHLFNTMKQRRLTATALAIKLYASNHVSRPERLADLVPDYLASIPFDPTDLDENSVRYSVGGLPLEVEIILPDHLHQLYAKLPLSFDEATSGKAQISKYVIKKEAVPYLYCKAFDPDDSRRQFRMRRYPTGEMHMEGLAEEGGIFLLDRVPNLDQEYERILGRLQKRFEQELLLE